MSFKCLKSSFRKLKTSFIELKSYVIKIVVNILKFSCTRRPACEEALIVLKVEHFEIATHPLERGVVDEGGDRLIIIGRFDASGKHLRLRFGEPIDQLGERPEKIVYLQKLAAILYQCGKDEQARELLLATIVDAETSAQQKSELMGYLLTQCQSLALVDTQACKTRCPSQRRSASSKRPCHSQRRIIAWP